MRRRAMISELDKVLLQTRSVLAVEIWRHIEVLCGCAFLMVAQKRQSDIASEVPGYCLIDSGRCQNEHKQPIDPS